MASLWLLSLAIGRLAEHNHTPDKRLSRITPVFQPGRGIALLFVGASLLAKAAAHPASMRLTYRFREQARSHRVLCFNGLPSPLREGGTLEPKVLHQAFCGSEPAREGGGTSSIDATDIPLSRAGSLPQGSVLYLTNITTARRLHSWNPRYRTGFCGSELAREGGGTSSIDVTDIPLSRASPLPQGLCGCWVSVQPRR
jgi:hypothetical protein